MKTEVAVTFGNIINSVSDPLRCLTLTEVPWAARSQGISEALALLRRQTIPAAREPGLAHPSAPATKTAG